MKIINYLSLIVVFNCINVIGQIQTKIDWPTLANSDWPMIKHDPQFTGRSSYKGPQTPTIVWTRDLINGIFSGPVIGEDENLYFGSNSAFSDIFYSYDSDGKFLWSYSTGTGRAPQSGILVDSSNTIYFGSYDSNFYALKIDGTLKWKYKTSDEISGLSIPNIDLQGRLYITNISGELYSINSDGTMNWSKRYESGFAHNSPVFSPDGNTLYIAGQDSNIFALNLDGSIKWKFSCAELEYAPLVDLFGNLYFAPFVSPPYFYSLFPDGNIRWQYGDFFFGEYSTPTIDNQGNIYTIATDTICCPYYKLLISLDYEGNFRWKYTFDDEETDDFFQPLICDSEGTVYVGSTYGYNYYAIANDGNLKWKLPLEFDNQQVDNTGAISKDGTLYLGVHGGTQKTLIAIKDTGVTSIGSELQVFNYNLEQNFPNPFNPKTTINFSLPEASYVKLFVYNLLGEEIQVLKEGYVKAGTYNIAFDGSHLPSGIYIYRLISQKYIASKKMNLIK